MALKKDKRFTINFNFNSMFKGHICYKEDTTVTDQNTRSKNPLSNSMHFATRVRGGLHVSLCGQQDPNGQQAIHLVYPTFLLCTSLFIHPRKQNLTELGPEIQIALPC